MDPWKPSEFVSYLKRKNIFHIVNANYSKVFSILKDSLKINHRDEFLIITDAGEPYRYSAPILAGCYLLAAKRLGVTVRLVILKTYSSEFIHEPILIQSLHNLIEDNVAALCLSRKMGTIHELGGTFSKIATLKRYRFVSTYNLRELPTSKFSSLINAIDIDYLKLQKQAQQIKRILDMGSEIKVLTDLGTQLTINIQGMIAYSNDAKEITAHGNIPVGEVYIAPRRNLVNGTLVIDGSIRIKDSTVILSKPVTVLIEKGNIIKITGGSEAEMLKETILFYLAENILAKRVCEFGIGINPKATICGPTIINEKALGTAHIAFGNNKSFGGTINAPNHLDQVFRKPRIYIDGRLLTI